MRSPAHFRIGAAALAAGLALACGDDARGEVAVIVSAKSPVTALRKSEISDIFLSRTRQFSNGEPAVPIDLPEGSSVRDEFYAKFAGKSPAQIKYHWARIIFTGRGLPPLEAGDSAAAKKMVAENPRAIGYIEPALVDASVRVVGSQ